MILELIMAVTATLSCPKTEFVNKSGEAFTDIDFWNYNRALTRCGEKYPNSPCVKVFTKISTQNYSVVCSAKQ